MRLCVETSSIAGFSRDFFAAAFGRLCVETAQMEGMKGFNDGSDLRVAVC